jgi:hypothetical protein
VIEVNLQPDCSTSSSSVAPSHPFNFWLHCIWTVRRPGAAVSPDLFLIPQPASPPLARLPSALLFLPLLLTDRMEIEEEDADDVEVAVDAALGASADDERRWGVLFNCDSEAV